MDVLVISNGNLEIESVRHVMINNTNSRYALCILSLIFTVAFKVVALVQIRKWRLGAPGGLSGLSV